MRPLPDKTRFIRALRPFSLVVAVATCGLGVLLALRQGEADPALALAVITAGVLLQAGVNLVNDHADRQSSAFSPAQRRAIGRNTRLGAAAFLLAGLFGLYLVWLRGWPMLALEVVGLAGALGYTGRPVNYKARGLGVPLVFLFMGVLLVGGAYYAVSGRYHAGVFWLSLPFSLFASLLLLSNELRDYEADLAEGLRTLTVRIGYERAARLYRGLILLLAAVTFALGAAGLLAYAVLPLLSLLCLLPPLRLLGRGPAERQALAPATGRGFFAYGCTLLAALWIAQ
ncbi:MAG: UbiA family prenyltransferase [Pseudohaliea sp.]